MSIALNKPSKVTFVKVKKIKLLQENKFFHYGSSDNFCVETF